jgi:hypothetical protein
MSLFTMVSPFLFLFPTQHPSALGCSRFAFNLEFLFSHARNQQTAGLTLHFLFVVFFVSFKKQDISFYICFRSLKSSVYRIYRSPPPYFPLHLFVFDLPPSQSLRYQDNNYREGLRGTKPPKLYIYFLSEVVFSIRF